MNLLICDDNREIGEHILSLIREKYIDTFQYKFVDSSEQLLQEIQNNTLDVLVLDIEIDERNGIDIKNILEERANSPYIIYVTSYDDYIFESYGVKVMGYLKKPIDKEMLYDRIDRILRIKAEHVQIKIIDMLNKERIIEEKNILYIEVNGGYSKLFLKDGSYVETRKSLNEWEYDLDSRKFYRTHKKYIVNLLEIQKINFHECYVNGNKIKISRERATTTKSNMFLALEYFGRRL